MNLKSLGPLMDVTRAGLGDEFNNGSLDIITNTEGRKMFALDFDAIAKKARMAVEKLLMELDNDTREIFGRTRI